MTEPTAAQERAAIIEWLRSAVKKLAAVSTQLGMMENVAIKSAIETYENAAEVIERGHHNGESK